MKLSSFLTAPRNPLLFFGGLASSMEIEVFRARTLTVGVALLSIRGDSQIFHLREWRKTS